MTTSATIPARSLRPGSASAPRWLVLAAVPLGTACLYGQSIAVYDSEMFLLVLTAAVGFHWATKTLQRVEVRLALLAYVFFAGFQWWPMQSLIYWVVVEQRYEPALAWVITYLALLFVIATFKSDWEKKRRSRNRPSA